MPDNTIDQWGIELVGDATGLVDSIQSGMDQAKDAVEQGVAEIAATMAAALSETELGQRIAAVWADFGAGSEQAKAVLEGIAEATGRTVQELNTLGTAYDENLKGRLVEALSLANVELQTTNTLSDQTIANLRALADEAGRVAAADKGIAAGMQGVNALADQYQKVTTATKDSSTATKDNTKAATDNQMGMAALNKVLGTVGLSVGSLISGVGLVTVAWKGLQAVMAEVSSSVGMVIRLAEANFRLEVTARAAQRSLGAEAMSIKEAKGYARELTDTYAQNIVSTTALTGKAIQLTMEMGLSKDQVKNLTKAAVVLNETIGTDSMSALTMMTMYMQTGFGRSLARMGFDVTRAAQQQEAYAIGINKTLKEMTEAEKQQVRMSLLMRQTNKYAEDATAGLDNYTKAMAHSNQEVEDQKETLGKLILPMKAIWEFFKKDLERVLVQGFNAALGYAILSFNNFVGTLAVGAAIVIDLFKGQLRSVKDYAGVYKRTFDILTDRAHKWVDTLNDAFGEGADSTKDFATQVKMATGEMEEAWAEATKDFAEDALKLKDDLDDAITGIWDDYNNAYDKGERDLQRSLRDIDEQAAEDRLKTIEDYQVEEIRMRQDHERRLKELENQYLLDLMDAVRERDALQVLMLQRRYNLEKQKEEDAASVGARRRKEDYQRELRDIAEQTARKKAERQRAFAEEMAELEIQSILRRKELEKNYAEELQALKDDIVKAGGDIIQQLLAAGYKPEVVLEVAKTLGKTIGQELGAGAANDFYATFLPVVQNALLAAYAAARAFSGVHGSASVTPPGGYAPYTSPGSRRRIEGFQTGGSFVATSPQTIRVGERPEQVTVQPLNEGTGAPRAGFGGSGRGNVKVSIGVNLSPGLEGEIVDQAMNEMADVVVSLNRESLSRPLGGAR